MKLRDLLLILLYITLQDVYGKSIGKQGRKYASVDKSTKEQSSVQNTRTKTNDNLGKQTSEKVNINLYNANNAKLKNKPGEGCTVNCTILFENPVDDGVNLMEEEKEEEKEENSGEHSASKGVESSSKVSNLVENENEDESSADDDMVEVDKPQSTETSQHTNDDKNNESKAAPVAATPNGAPKEKADPARNKNKQVALTPQSAVQEGTKSAVSNMSDASKYPSLPIPQMIPLPLFHISGENEGSALNQLASDSDTKNTTEMDEFNGESGYGELFQNSSQKPLTKPAPMVKNPAPSGRGAPGKSVPGKPLPGKSLPGKGKRIHLHAGKKVVIDTPALLNTSSGNTVNNASVAVSRKITPRVDSKLAAAKPGGGIAVTVLQLRALENVSDIADVLQSCLDNRTGDEVYRRNCLLDWLDKVDKSSNHQHKVDKSSKGVQKPAAVAAPAQTPPNLRDNEETTTDYPFVVSDGPKANIHPILNSKIKIGNDHDEDLVDYYDEDDDGDDAPPSQKQYKYNANGDVENEETESESGDADTAPSLDEDGTAEQQGEEEENEYMSGSGSGNSAADYSGDSASDSKEEESKKKKDKGKKIKTKTFEFGPGELGGNNLPIVVPVISKHKDAEDPKKPSNAQDENKPSDAKDVKKNNKDKTKKAKDSAAHTLADKTKKTKASSAQKLAGDQPDAQQGVQSNNNSVAAQQKDLAKGPKKVEKEKWIVDHVNLKQDIKSILTQFGGNQPRYTATAGAPQALPPPAGAAQPLAQAATNNKVVTNPAEFLQNGLGTKIVSEIAQISGGGPQPAAPLAPQAPIRVATSASQRNACMGLCLTSCDPHCDPACCRSGFAIGGGVTAQVLPIPDDLNKVIKDAGIGPGTTAQILPTPENKKMLQQAGFADGVTARIIPIPVGFSLPNGQVGLSSRSGATPKAPDTTQWLARSKAKPNTGPQSANLNKESQQPPHPPISQAAAVAQMLARPPAPQVVGGAQVPPVPPQVQQQPGQALPSAAQTQPPPPAVNQQATGLPNGQTQDPSARDQGITALTNLPNGKQPARNDQPPASQKADPVARIETLPEGEKNYDETTYAEILSQLPPSVAPEAPLLHPLPVTQTLTQFNVNDHMARQPPVNMFFRSVKRQDPYQNLEAYKRQEFKNYDEQFLVDDR